MATPTIERVDAFGLAAPLDEPFGYAQAWVETREAVLVRIEASDGTVGWGECWRPAAGTTETVEEVLAPELLGEDPTHVPRLFDHLYDYCRALYQAVVPLPSLSGVDLALWDLAGKFLDQPVSTLLGGARRDSVRAYATGHYFPKTDDVEAIYGKITDEAAENAASLGAIKLKTGLQLVGYGPDEDIELVRRVRDRVGDDVTIMVDANFAYRPATARRVGRALEAVDVHWFEEPVHPEDWAGYVHLRDALDVKIAGGECHVPHEFPRLFERGALDVAQPDACIVGGLTPTRRIADAALRHGVEPVPHVWGTPVALAASLQLVATLEGRPWLEFDGSPNPLREALSDHVFEADEDGRVAVPDGPGIGIDVDESAVERFRVSRR